MYAGQRTRAASCCGDRFRESSGLSTKTDSRLIKWRSRPRNEIAWAKFDDDFVAYHRPSGKTHFLNAASYNLLNEILIEPRSLSAILEMFATEETDENADAYLEQMTEMLTHIEALGLIERA